MGNSSQITQTGKKNQTQIKSPVAESPDSIASLTPEMGPSFNGPSVESQAEMLNRVPASQGQTIATKIGGTQGNRHLQRVITALKNTPVRTKLTVSEPGDNYEQEADQVAEQVMKMPASAPPPPIAGAGAGNNDEDARNSNRPAALNRYVQRAPIRRSGDDIGGGEVDSGVESRIQNLQRGGTPLPQTERNFFESRMGVDLSNVKVHNDNEAIETSADLNAQAYTVGSDVAFGAGKYAPGTTAGRRLLAHELTHVVQQGGAGELQRQVEEKKDEQLAVEIAPPETQADGFGKTASSLNTEKNAQKPGSAAQTADAEKSAPSAGQESTDMEQKAGSMGSFETAQGFEGARGKDRGEDQSDATGDAESSTSQAEAATASQSPKDGAPRDGAPRDGAPRDGANETTAEQEAQPESAQGKPDEAQAGAPQDQAETAEKEPTAGEEQAASQETAEKEEAAGEEQAESEEVAEKAQSAGEEQIETDPEEQKEANALEAELPIEGAEQVDAAVMQQAEAKLEHEQDRQEKTTALVEETHKEMAELDGADAIIPENLWKDLHLEQRRDEITSKEPAAEKPRDFSSIIGPDLLIQRTPDTTVQRQPNDPQGTPVQISVPTITIDTEPITTAAAGALKAADFATKLTDLTSAVAAARERVNTLGPDTLKKLDGQLETTLTDLELDAVQVKLDIADRYNTANTALNDMLPGLHQRVGDVVEVGCTKVDEVVQEYVNKCDTDAEAAIQPYCDIQNNTDDDGTLPIFGGPGEESGYHGRKAKAAKKAALQVAEAYKNEYKTQGADTKSVFRNDVYNDFYQMMTKEVAGMQTTLTTAKEDADQKVDDTKGELIKQAKELHKQSTATLEQAIKDTLADLTEYESKLITELTNAQTAFGTQVQASADQAVADVNAALAQAQSALSGAIQSATGPGQAFSPGAQAAIDQAAANIKTKLTQQIAEAAGKIAKQGTDMAGDLSGIDVKAGSAAYADTFESTTKNMCTQVIDNGLVAINKNLIQYGADLTTESDTRFQAYVTAASNGIKQIEDAGKTNLPNFVETEFKSGLEQAHGKLAAQAKDEGEKAGEAVQPLWKTILKAIVAIVIAVVIAVVIAAVVAATGGLAGVLLGVLVGAVLGGIGGAIKCVANSLIDTGQLPTKDDLIRDVAMGALSGAITGLTAGLLGVAFQGTLTAGQMLLKEGIDSVAGAVKDAVVEACTQQWKNGTVDWGSVGGTFVRSLVINVVAAGIFKGPNIWKTYKAGQQGASSAIGGAANQLDDAANKIDDGAAQAPPKAEWSKPPTSDAAKKAQELGLPEPASGYRWNMTKAGVPYQQRMPGMKDILPDPPKFNIPTSPATVPSGAVPSGSTVGNAVTPPAKAPFWNGDAFNKKMAPIKPWYNPVESTENWANQAWGKQTEKYVTKETYKDLASHSDYDDSWDYSDGNPGISDEANTWSDDFGQTHASQPMPSYQWNTQTPKAPGYKSADWNFKNGEAIPTVDTPDSPDIDFDAGVDQADLEQEVVAP